MPLHVVSDQRTCSAQIGDILVTWNRPQGGTQRAHAALVSRAVGRFPGEETLKLVHLAGVSPCTVQEIAFRELASGPVSAIAVRGTDLGRETRQRVLRVARETKRRLRASDLEDLCRCVYGFEPAAPQVVRAPDPINRNITLFTFSCATFVHHCYAEALGDPSAIVDIEDLPATADHASDPLFEPLQLRRDVRRLYPAYLMAATLHDEYPFKRWIPTVRFPYQVLALTLRAAGIHEGRLKLAALLGDAGAAHALGGALPDGALSAALGEIADLGSEITVRVLLAAGLGEVGEAAESIRKEIGNWLGSPSQETLQAVSHALRGTSPEVLESAPYTFSAARAAIGETPLSECISQIVTADASLIARVTAVVLPWALGFQE